MTSQKTAAKETRTVFATSEAIDYDFYSEDLPARSETHLQLSLKLKIVGKKLCGV